MRCPRCNDDDDAGPICTCGRPGATASDALRRERPNTTVRRDDYQGPPVCPVCRDASCDRVHECE